MDGAKNSKEDNKKPVTAKKVKTGEVAKNEQKPEIGQGKVVTQAAEKEEQEMEPKDSEEMMQK